MKKKIFTGLAALAVILVVGGLLLGSNLETIIKAAVEKYGTEATLGTTKLANVKLDLSEGKASLEGFTLANPDGFSNDVAISFSNISVEIYKDSIIGDGPIKIRQILIKKPMITYEVNEDGSNNLKTFQKNIVAFSGKLDKQKAKETAEGKKEAKKKERNFVIEEIVIRDGNLKIKHALLKDAKIADIDLPPIHMFHIGHGENGITPAILAHRVLSQIIIEAMITGQSTAMRELSSRSLAVAREAVKEASKAAETAATQAVDAVKDSEVGKAIGDLLGK